MNYLTGNASKLGWAYLVAAALLLSPGVTGQEGAITLTAEDKKEIVRQVLEREVVRMKEGSNIKKGDVIEINLSTKNIGPELVPEVEGVRFKLVEPERVREKSIVGFRHLAFGEFKQSGPVVTVTLSNNYRRVRFVNNRTFSYEFRRVDGKWEGKLVKEGRLIS
jgi:hypothetical protein